MMLLLGFYFGGAIVFCDSTLTAMSAGEFQDEAEVHGAAMVVAVIVFVIATWPIQMLHDRIKNR